MFEQIFFNVLQIRISTISENEGTLSVNIKDDNINISLKNHSEGNTDSE